MRTSAPDGHRLLDQRGDEVRVETERSTPQFSLNIHSFLGWFTRAITGHRELLLGEQRDHEVVLVVAGGRDHDVAALEPGVLQDDTSQASAMTHSTLVGVGTLDHGRVAAR